MYRFVQGIFLTAADAVLTVWNLFAQFMGLFISWLFDPAVVFEAGRQMFVWLCQTLGAILPSSIGTPLASFGSIVGGVPIQKAWLLVVYFTSPVCSASVLSATMLFALYVWAACMIIRLVIWIASMVW